MEKRAYTPYLILIGLFAIAALALAFTVDVSLDDQPGIRMELPVSLAGGWTGDELRYSHNPDHPKQYLLSQLELPDTDPETGEKLYTMSLAEYDALPHDTQFVKSIYTNEISDQVFVSIVLSGSERNSIHRPQRCLPGQGNTITATKYIKVPLEGRKPLDVCVLEIQRRYSDKEGNPQTYYGYYAYWFIGQGRETASHYERMFWLAWDRVVRSVAHKWAYVAVSGDRKAAGETYQTEITEFVQKIYPQLLLDENEG
ncbi:MAG: exosortase-associated EpsI family protein [Kiritimatiellales bacterium]